ncbi:GerMN domain-containing protein [Paenibacillus hunanensis]|uniref:GerMN domain-containing protein n=1 Tax=Paenibacillus hunanensis TaxID=539262 RepID=A0ABU1IXF9_9BACL|nr:GerMN domain-containing protein [Paenibacillus hunanensis]MCL9661278.1 GerMN domain-containing protein [Paenibacillus hunanensis]MDR6243859.1 hypothetical protein [Paenibacillus hunanensis]GGJ25525.1 hypothetical protein GCM10008022_37900 [Paenibacillus hunanensis]
MKKGIYLFILICTLCAFSIGCDHHPSSSKVQGSKLDLNEASTENNEAEKQKKSQKIEVYYADVQVSKLEKNVQSITFTDATHKYSETYTALQKSDQDNLIPLWGNIDLLSVAFNEGKLTLDIHIPDEARLGSGGEALAMEALTKTFFQFSEINSIELLVDGKETDSLMGHTELDNPILRP